MSSSQIIMHDCRCLLPNNTLIPVSHVTVGAEPVFVNCKQYEAILRRREKKRRLVSQVVVQKRAKYKSRSLHAKRRARTGDGKFIGKKTATAERVTEAEERIRNHRRLAEQPNYLQIESSAEKWMDSRQRLAAWRKLESEKSR